MKKIIVNFILDKSRSMQEVRNSTISGFNEYISTLKEDKKSEYEFTLTLFDTSVETVIKAKSLKSVKKLDADSYKPNGGTALYDAVCSTILNTKVEGQKVINVIMTDGEENSSSTYTEKDMRMLIKVLENQGNWTFVYLGANQDSYKAAQKFGFQMGNVSNFNATSLGMSATMRSVASNTMNFSAASGTATNAFFSKADQDMLNETK